MAKTCKDDVWDYLQEEKNGLVLDRTNASKDDFYAQVIGEDKSGRVWGVGTGPTPSTLWETSHEQLKAENKRLNDRMKELEDRFSRVETILSMGQGSKIDVSQGSPPIVQSSVASTQEDTSDTLYIRDVVQLQGKRVKLLDLDHQHVESGIVMSIDKDKIVMWHQIGNAYCEVSLTFVVKLDAPLIVKDHIRKKMKDVLGTHILWLIEYVHLDSSMYKSC